VKNFIQQGNTLDLTAPAGGLVSGQGHLFGDLFGVAATNIQEGTKGAVALTGVYSLPKAAGEAMAEGAVAYWDGAKITATAAGNAKAGNVAEATAAAAASVAVRLAN
jgi:predicted RecA/RadA family phage recombinase